MSWRGVKGGIEAARAKHDVVMAPTSHTYFDYAQSKAPGEPVSASSFLPLETVYAYEPDSLGAGTAVRRARSRRARAIVERIYADAETGGIPGVSADGGAGGGCVESERSQGFLRIPENASVHQERLRVLDVNFRPMDPR